MKRRISRFALLLALPLMGAAAPPVLTYELAPVMEDGKLTAVAVTLRFQADEDGETRLALPDSWGGNVNGVELTDSGTLVRFEGTDPSFQAQYNKTNPIDLGGATTVNFVYSTTPGFTPVANAFSFTAALQSPA